MGERNGKTHREEEEQDTIEQVQGKEEEAPAEEEEAAEETEDTVNASYPEPLAAVLPPPPYNTTP